MDNVPTAEELAAEQEILAHVPKEEEVRSKIVAEFGFDEVDDAGRIDKLVADKMETSKKLSAAVNAKIKHREEAAALKNDPRLRVAETPAVVKPAAEDLAKTVNDSVTRTLEQRDLDAMEYSDEIKKEIQRIAQITGKTVKQAAKDPYIVSTFIGPWEKEQNIEAASINRTNRSAGKVGLSMDNPPEVDMATEEGRKKWDAWKADMIKKGN